MRLENYLEQTGQSSGAFARYAKIPRGTVRAILDGRVARGPRVDTARKIVIATGGLVGYEDLTGAPAESGAA